MSHSLETIRVLVVELARLHAIACRVYGLGPEAVPQGTRFRRCHSPFHKYDVVVGHVDATRRPFGAIGSVSSRNCYTMRIAARDPTLALVR